MEGWLRHRTPLMGEQERPLAFDEDGLAQAERFARYLVCRSRAPCLIECNAAPPARIRIRRCRWPADTDGPCPDPDALPDAVGGCIRPRQQRLLRELLRLASPDSVVLLEGIEFLPAGRARRATLARLARETRYLVLHGSSDGCALNAAPASLPFEAWTACAGIAPAFSRPAGLSGDRTFLALGGREAVAPPGETPPARALALMSVYNEEDILEETLHDLIRQGLDIFVIDNGSTDRTVDLLASVRRSSGRLSWVSLPPHPSTPYLDRKAHYTAILDEVRRAVSAGYTWMLLTDADEIRWAPWPGATLSQAFAHVERLGYNAVDFTVLDYRFLRDEPAVSPPFSRHLQHFEFGARPGHFRQIKAWRHGISLQADLYESRGHAVHFPGRRVFPLKFLLQHYPLRTRTQAWRKIYRDRLPRFDPREKAEGHHIQYDAFLAHPPDGWHRDELLERDADFHSKYLVERLSGIGLAGRRDRQS